MDYNFLLDGINKIEKIQEEQSIAIAMLQGYILASKQKDGNSNKSPSNKQSQTVIKINKKERAKNGLIIITGEELRKYNGKTIRKRLDGRYELRLYKDKKYISIYGKTQNECITKYKELINQKSSGKNYKNVTVEEWLSQWLKLYKENKVAKSTLDQMKRYLKSVQPLYKHQLKKVTPLILQEFLNSIEKPRKREKIQVFLKDAFSKAVKTKVIENNPFDGVESIRRDKKQSRSLTLKEEEILIAECKESQFGKLFLVCLYTGMRLGEALALTQKDIDYENNKINISKSINDYGEVVKPKTKTSIRTIPLFDKAKEIIKDISTDRLFTYTKTSYQNKMAKMCKKLGLTNVSTHTLRHTFATRCAEAGIPPKIVQKWLGHSTIEMTMNIYTHVDNEYEQKMVKKVNNFDPYFDPYLE